MVIIQTYCEINCALITYKQMTQKNLNQHQHDSPTNMTHLRNSWCFKYWLANVTHKSHIISAQHPQVNGCLHLGPLYIPQWSFQRIVSFQISKTKQPIHLVLYSCGLHQSCQSLSTQHRTWQHSLKKRQNMVIIPTYSEINCVLITYKQMTCINHKQHQHNSPTNMKPIRNN